MKIKLSKFLISFCLSVVFIISSSPFVSAASNVYKISINQPRADNYSGYIEYLLQTPDGNITPFVSFWHIVGSTKKDNTVVGDPYVIVTVTPTRVLLQAMYVSDGGNEFYFVLNGGSVNGHGGSNYWSYGSQGGNSVSANAYTGSGTIISYKLYGNYSDRNSTVAISDYNDYSFVYSENSVLYETLLLFANSMGAGNQAIIQNATDNTNKLINAGSDKGQPDFGSTNGKLDSTVGQIESIEGSYQIDQTATNTALSNGTNFLQGSDMQRASIQVKTWIERFSSENRVVTGFLIAAMVLGLCFWVIGRKAGSE